MRRSLLAALLAFLLASCIRTVGPDYELKPDSSRSVIIVSLTASGRIPGELHFARRGDQQWSVTTADRRDRDFPLLEKKLPNVPTERVAIRLLK